MSEPSGYYRTHNISLLTAVGLANSSSAPLCSSLAAGGACPNQAVKPPLTAYYLARSAPDNSYCPARGIGTRATLVPATFEGVGGGERVTTPARFAITDNGMRIREAIGQLNMGDKVWSMSEDGTETTGTIVGFE